MKTALNPLTRLVLVAVLAFALAPAYADPGGDAQGRGRGGRDANPQGRQWEQDARPQRQGPPAQRPGEDARGQRLSPEERQQLRRDIKDAGKEIYPPRR